MNEPQSGFSIGKYRAVDEFRVAVQAVEFRRSRDLLGVDTSSDTSV
jgi:hypothetical protein